MMNLLIGILSEKLVEILAIKEQILYSELLEMIIVLEEKYSWFSKKPEYFDKHHLVYVIDTEILDGVVVKDRHIINPLTKVIDQVTQKMNEFYDVYDKTRDASDDLIKKNNKKMEDQNSKLDVKVNGLKAEMTA
jgi:hypothetical protein